jgi:hypothetical protein
MCVFHRPVIWKQVGTSFWLGCGRSTEARRLSGDRTNPLRQKPSRSSLHVRTARDVPEIKKYQLEGRLAVPVQLQICAIHTR